MSSEVKELFQYIGRYKPQTIELDTKLKPFIPDYIPAIGLCDTHKHTHFYSRLHSRHWCVHVSLCVSVCVCVCVCVYVCVCVCACVIYIHIETCMYIFIYRWNRSFSQDSPARRAAGQIGEQQQQQWLNTLKATYSPLKPYNVHTLTQKVRAKTTCITLKTYLHTLTTYSHTLKPYLHTLKTCFLKLLLLLGPHGAWWHVYVYVIYIYI